jgi:hypothetical protein
MPIRHAPSFCLELLASRSKPAAAASGLPADHEAERELNAVLRGEPRNHDYQVHDRRLRPSFALYCRTRTFNALYPRPLTSFLDIGCCRGFYALQAGSMPQCRTAVGIDVYEPSIRSALKAKEYLGASNVSFHLSQLHEVAADPAAFGGPFQTVMLVGTYHYLFWGSSLSKECYRDHHKIMSLLEKVCTDRVIFSARLEKKHLPHYLQPPAEAAPEGKIYTTEGFLQAAREHFNVRQAGSLGKYLLLVMSKR